MIYKLTVTTALLLTIAYGSVNEQIEYSVWKTTIAKKGSGESCDDGNCLTRSNCFTKDGKGYKLLSSCRDKVKKKCKKLF